ncbi:MAG: hypothetical protein IT342_24265 [Candidatus Melainabacteria bacterium]|nr:hypothetical protein [Candidatus Melainabacteria bacterium]
MAKPEIKQPTVRVNAATKVKLDEIKSRTDLSHPDLLEKAVDLLALDMQVRQLESDLSDMIADKASLAEYQRLTAIFDGASKDGLK